MAYQGYLFKVGNFTIPFNMMFTESFKASKNDQDIDSYVDADGNLQRNALSHWRFKCEWTIPPMKKSPELENFFQQLYNQFRDTSDPNANEIEKSATCTAYVTELGGEYHTGKMYLNSSVDIEIYRATPEYVQYKAVRIAFVEY